MEVQIRRLPKSEIELEGELPEKDFSAYRSPALLHLAAKTEVAGFRRGMAPEQVLLRKIGEMAVLEEMARLALDTLYPKLVAEHRLDLIGAPDITITKLGIGSPLGFKIKGAVLPEVKLPEYRAIAKETNKTKETIEVSSAEIDGTLEELRKQRAAKKEASDEARLPDLNDEFAKSLGGFGTLAELKEKIGENMRLEKETRAREKKRIALIEKILERTAMEVPNLLVEVEIGKMKARLKEDLRRLGLSWEGYLKNVGKDEGGLEEAWRPEAEKRATIELVLMHIATTEKLRPEKAEIEKEMHHILAHHTGVDRERAREYVTHLLTNEKVFEFLEGLR